VTEQQFMAACPQCGSSAAVHAISELAGLAQMQLGQAQQGSPAGPAGSQQGYLGEPQSGALPGYMQEPQAGPPPGSAGAGWRSGLGGLGRGGISRNVFADRSVDDSIEGAVADIALGAAAQFIGRALRKRVEKTMTERVLPAVAAGRENILRQQVAIAERYPGIRACLNDSVIFLDGGSRTAPMPNISTLTMEQADALVAQLKQG
jgi:hypothetical protein